MTVAFAERDPDRCPTYPPHEVGYGSLGCIPFTSPPRLGEDESAGRWAGSDKLECGIHLEASQGGR